MAAFREAHGMEMQPGSEMKAAPASRASHGYMKDHEQANVIRRYPHVHEGKGAIDVKFFFRGERRRNRLSFSYRSDRQTGLPRYVLPNSENSNPIAFIPTSKAAVV